MDGETGDCGPPETGAWYPPNLARSEGAALQATPCQFGEETLYGMHPGTGGGYEGKVQIGARVQPGMDIGGLIRGVGVQDHRHGGGELTSVFSGRESVAGPGTVGATVSGSVKSERLREGNASRWAASTRRGSPMVFRPRNPCSIQFGQAFWQGRGCVEDQVSQLVRKCQLAPDPIGIGAMHRSRMEWTDANWYFGPGSRPLAKEDRA